ncbi:HD-GYP domain-containing protein [Sphingomonas sp. KR3-1]|uniref:HD-GYP domain-containing protein n=1 Tax=Sphingomonas sp. KR3-1 TaxID=3156611 RepID=UPI0032B5FD84
MLKRIPPGQVKLGMFIHGFEGSWLTHPFWRSRFLLERASDLALLHASEVPAVIIDVSRGLAPDAPAETAPHPVAIRAPVSAEHPTPDAAPSPWTAEGSPDAQKADREAARRTIAEARLVVQGIYENAGKGLPIDADEAGPVVAEIADCVARNPAMFIDMARLKSKDEYTYLHSVSVCGLMVNLAREIGLDEAKVRAMGLAGLLHDVGKMSVPAEVLNKPGRLNEDEFALIRQHPENGHVMLYGGKGVNQEALDVCLMHHEKMDGTGYPFGLEGRAISLAARMGAICDVYDALTSDRIYKERWTPLRAVTEMHSWTGHFDPALLFAFCHSIGVAPTGMLVRLRSGRLGVVLPDGTHGTRSKIRAFHSIQTHRSVPLEDLFKGVSDVVTGFENPADWGFTQWDAAVRKLIEGHPVAPDAPARH